MSPTYRDETTAALERAEGLERENQRLRAALEERGLSAPEADSGAQPGADNSRFGGNAALVAIFAVPVLGGLVIAIVALALLVKF